MFGLCTITTISLVGMIWFRSFEKQLFVLLNPEPEKQERFLAERDARTPTLFATISNAAGDLKASMVGLLGLFNVFVEKAEVEGTESNGQPRLLPLSGDK